MLLAASAIGTTIVPATGQTTAGTDTRSSAPQLRKLTGDDAKRAEELDKAIEAAVKADRFGEAISSAEELVALRTQAQGPGHFDTTNAEWRLKTLRQASLMPYDDRFTLRSASALIEQSAGPL